MSAIGIEVNPFLAFVARTKLASCRAETVLKHTTAIIKGMKMPRPSSLEGFSTFTENATREKWLFNLDVIRAFEGGWQATQNVFGQTRDVLRLCLIGAAMDVCNAFPDGKCLRYHADWKKRAYDASALSNAFEIRVGQVAADLGSTPFNVRQSVIHTGDCRSLIQSRLTKPFRLCVTSPPYLNSFDYSDIYRPELFLGKFIHNNNQLRKIRLRTVRSHVQVKWEAPKKALASRLLKDSLEGIKSNAALLWDDRLPDMIRAYFEDWAAILTSLGAKAVPDSYLWIVVSTSAYAGIEIPVDLILAELATKKGWFLREVGVLRYLRSSGQHWHKVPDRVGNPPRLRESVVILGAQPRKT
jgi:hypothetical protein